MPLAAVLVIGSWWIWQEVRQEHQLGGYCCNPSERRRQFALWGGSECGDTWSGSGYIFQVESAGYADRLDVCSERKEGVKDNSKVFALSSCKDTIYSYGKD